MTSRERNSRSREPRNPPNGSSGSIAAAPSPTLSPASRMERWSPTNCWKIRSVTATRPFGAFANCSAFRPAKRFLTGKIEVVKMGTTVATNALLERKGDRVVFVTTKGFRDALRLAYQNRPRLFDRDIELPEMLYERAIEAVGRFNAQGAETTPLDRESLRRDLQAAHDDGIRACAIVFMHGYRHVAHETVAAEIARDIGFTRPGDREPGNRPVVYAQMTAQAVDLAITEEQVRVREGALHRLGALAWNDSGNHKRFGRRDPATGRIVGAFGVDLSPLAALVPSVARRRRGPRHRRLEGRTQPGARADCLRS